MSHRLVTVSDAAPAANLPSHSISVVTPVYQGALTLGGLAAELRLLTDPQTTPGGQRWVISEWLLVHDHGPDTSADTIGELAEQYEFVRPIWLSRNFGQHPATLAGMTSSTGDWVVTLDEDGQHNPADIAVLLDTAVESGASLVYADPVNAAPHGWFRNLLSRGAKWLFVSFLAGSHIAKFNSFRLVIGEAGRSIAAYAGAGTYLDVALSWVIDDVAYAPVVLRSEGGRKSGYSFRSLLSHFWRLVLSSGTHMLRMVSALGASLSLAGLVFAAYVAISSLFNQDLPEGWTTTLVVLLIASGAILFSLGIIAEYIGIAVNMAMGRPPFLIVSDPANGPLGRRPRSAR